MDQDLLLATVEATQATDSGTVDAAAVTPNGSTDPLSTDTTPKTHPERPNTVAAGQVSDDSQHHPAKTQSKNGPSAMNAFDKQQWARELAEHLHLLQQEVDSKFTLLSQDIHDSYTRLSTAVRAAEKQVIIALSSPGAPMSHLPNDAHHSLPDAEAAMLLRAAAAATGGMGNVVSGALAQVGNNNPRDLSPLHGEDEEAVLAQRFPHQQESGEGSISATPAKKIFSPPSLDGRNSAQSQISGEQRKPSPLHQQFRPQMNFDQEHPSKFNPKNHQLSAPQPYDMMSATSTGALDYDALIADVEAEIYAAQQQIPVAGQQRNDAQEKNPTRSINSFAQLQPQDLLDQLDRENGAETTHGTSSGSNGVTNVHSNFDHGYPPHSHIPASQNPMNTSPVLSQHHVAPTSHSLPPPIDSDLLLTQLGVGMNGGGGGYGGSTPGGQLHPLDGYGVDSMGNSPSAFHGSHHMSYGGEPLMSGTPSGAAGKPQVMQPVIDKSLPLAPVDPPANPMATPSHVLVEFKRGRVLQFDSSQYVVRGEYVVVIGDRGEDVGLVVYSWPRGTQPVPPEHVKWSGVGVGKVTRIATVLEISQLQGVQAELENRAQDVAQQKVLEHQLPMQIVDAEYQFDRKKLTFYYQSQHRLDFRNLVRDLYKTFRARIWMELA